MEYNYKIKMNEIYAQIGACAKMVLATSYQDHVTARTMSFVILDGNFYFQTDIHFTKYQEMTQNKNVALCLDNIQIEGVCEEIGHPLDNAEFCKYYKKYHLSSYEAYTGLSTTRLFRICPTYIQRWKYVNGKPFIEKLFIGEEKLTMINYLDD